MFYIIRGTKTGDPLSALCFILVIDRICLPMVEYAIRCMGLINEEKVSPLPAQAFADDIVVTSNNEDIINGMFAIARPHMKKAGLEIKPSKCAVFAARRSGNNWYVGKHDLPPSIYVQDNLLSLKKKDECYTYKVKTLL